VSGSSHEQKILEVSQMLKSFVLIAMLLICVAGFGQQSAQATSSGDVRAGEVVTFNVTLDKAPAFADPAIQVFLAPSDGGPGVQNIALAKDSKTDYKVSLRIPATATEGTWVVRQVRLLVPAGRSIPLKVSPAEFHVTAAEALELPTEASVSLVK
jgi:hypothetical protein